MDFNRATGPREITEVTRRAIVDALLLLDFNFHGQLDIVTFLGRVWNLKEMPSADHRFRDLEGDMRQHIPWNDDGYDKASLLYGKLDVVHVPDETFGRLLTETLHPVVQQRHDNVSDLLTMYNRKLHADGFVIVESGQISGEPIYTMAKIGLQLARQVEKYDVALSYAGEQQYYVEQIATMLRNAGVRVFYAPHEEAQLWGEDLVEAFEAVFLHGSRFVVMFVSADYERKAWPTVERRAAIERAISQKSAYILPVRFDDTSIPGLRGTVSYQEAARKTPAEIANLIIERLRT